MKMIRVHKGRVVRVVPCVGLLALCLISGGGCSALGKKSAPASTTPPPVSAAPRLPTDAGLARTAAPDKAVTPVAFSGLLAGQVIDSFGRNPPPTFIQVSAPADGSEPASAPIEVEANPQGYFTIQGLQPGRHYLLTARAKNGDRMMAGTTWATAPNPKVLIRISEDNARATTPVLPGPPAYQRPTISDPLIKTPTVKDAPADAGWRPQGSAAAGSTSPSAVTPTTPPATQPAPGRAADIGAPIKYIDGESAPKPEEMRPAAPRIARPESVTDASDPRLASTILDIKSGPGSVLSDAPPGSMTITPSRLPVPSCQLTGRQLYNFALNDLYGQPWEYKSHRGRLVLIDFWGTWCVPCLNAIPHLNILQDRYAANGLEVIGIAYEEGTPAEQARKVERVRQRLHMSYRVLLGSDRSTCPVRTQFGVTSFPTLVLLDEHSRILWRSEGLPEPQLRDLDLIIRRQLGLR
jgi:thiol-disulfide isomerase/thioredoxin